MKKSVFLLTIILTLTPSLFAKRPAPGEITPLVYNGIKYIVHHWGDSIKKKQNGGFIEAFDLKKRRRLWLLRVYEIEYNKNAEKDLQDIFITRIEIKNNRLIIRNEKNDIFMVDLKTRRIKPGNKKYRFPY